ncbi:hypothetical protein CMT56_07410 [Elizabethkingia anophelis]|nr:hypothetical protein [Elizabethkingia anophelis]MDV3861775.1 hypothetical protein [Elizabethkingia anophelis]MDV3906838.1 hypothetical protein [Elizabethkingia anophelis]MDV3925343.1 hypothetical protein [Elizabethkingia anophelis]MDV3987848.1 hypothetical protein [Elizabethkingia anophelis]
MLMLMVYRCLKNKFLINYLIVLIPFFVLLIPIKFVLNQNSVCIFKNITGYECYGCGITRAVFFASRFRFQEAIQFNKLVVVVYPLLVYLWIKSLIKVYRSLKK